MLFHATAVRGATQSMNQQIAHPCPISGGGFCIIQTGVQREENAKKERQGNETKRSNRCETQQEKGNRATDEKRTETKRKAKKEEEKEKATKA